MIIGPRSRVRPSEGGRFFGLAFCLCAVPFLREVFFFAVDRLFVVLGLPAAFLRATLFATRFFVGSVRVKRIILIAQPLSLFRQTHQIDSAGYYVLNHGVQALKSAFQ